MNVDEQNTDREPQPQLTPRDVYAAAIVFEGGMAVVAGLIGWWIGVPPLESITRHDAHWLEPLRALGWGLAAAVPLAAALIMIDRLRWGSLGELHRTVEKIVVPLFAPLNLGQLAVVAVLAGVGEEMLFRGLLQTSLAQWFATPTGVWAAILVASLAFGACHYLTTPYFVVATVIGVYLGVVFIWTDNLLAPMATHAAYDFFALLYIIRRNRASDR